MKPVIIIAIVAVAMIGIGIPSVFADQFDGVNLSQLELTLQESSLVESTDANVLIIKLKAKNNSNNEISGYGTYPYLKSGSATYNPSYTYELEEYGVSRDTCSRNPIIPAGLSKNMILCFVIPKDHSYPFTLNFYDNDKSYCGVCEYCTCTSTNLSITNTVPNIPIVESVPEPTYSSVPEPTGIASYSLYTDPGKNFSLKYPSTWLIEQVPFVNTVIFSDNSDWSVQAIVYDLGIIPGIDTQSAEDRYYGTYGGASLSCKLMTFESTGEICYDILPVDHGTATLESGEKIHTLGYTSTREFEGYNTPIQFFSIITDFTRGNHVWELEFTYDTSMTSMTSFDEKQALILKDMLNSFTITPVPIVEPTGIASFVDQSKDPQSYVDRYNNEPTYKEWFDENYSQYSSIYEAVGLEEPVMEAEPVMDPEPELTCGTGTVEKNGICVVDTPNTKSSEGGGCLIATATYGSEMALEVQQLRELRDNTLLQTESGTAFMGTFNDIYYSFSPIIADYERENPVFREAVKIAITPMISSLSILNYVEMDSESEVLGYGISLILLNLGMYLGIPAVVIIGIRKIK